MASWGESVRWEIRELRVGGFAYLEYHCTLNDTSYWRESLIFAHLQSRVEGSSIRNVAADTLDSTICLFRLFGNACSCISRAGTAGEQNDVFSTMLHHPSGH